MIQDVPHLDDYIYNKHFIKDLHGFNANDAYNLNQSYRVGDEEAEITAMAIC